jgi:hypothetical protein
VDARAPFHPAIKKPRPPPPATLSRLDKSTPAHKDLIPTTSGSSTWRAQLSTVTRLGSQGEVLAPPFNGYCGLDSIRSALSSNAD